VRRGPDFHATVGGAARISVVGGDRSSFTDARYVQAIPVHAMVDQLTGDGAGAALRKPLIIAGIAATEVIESGAKHLLGVAVQAEVSAFIAEHAHLLDETGCRRLVRHGFAWALCDDGDRFSTRCDGACARPRVKLRWDEDQVPLVAGSTISAQGLSSSTGLEQARS